MSARPASRIAAAAFLALGLIWGSNFIFMKWAAETITAGQITFLRVVCGFVPVLVYALIRGDLKTSHLRHAHHFLVMSILATSVYYFAFASGTALLPSGIAGALSGAIPLFTFLAAAVFLRSERITPPRVLGVVAGFGGVLLIARPWNAAVAVDPTGVFFMLLGSASVGLSFVYARKFLVGLSIPAAALTTYQMGLGVLVLAVVTDFNGVAALGGDLRAVIALVIGLGLLGTGVAYILYYFIVDRLGAIMASSATYIPPVVALAIGGILVGEPIDGLHAVAVLLILAGVAALRPRKAPQPVEAPGSGPLAAADARHSGGTSSAGKTAANSRG